MTASKHPLKSAWQSKRKSKPLNEFIEMQELLTGAFPFTFLFGKSYECNALITPKQTEHLLLQYTNSAATNLELLFYLFDCKS